MSDVIYRSNDHHFELACGKQAKREISLRIAEE